VNFHKKADPSGPYGLHCLSRNDGVYTMCLLASVGEETDG